MSFGEKVIRVPGIRVSYRPTRSETKTDATTTAALEGVLERERTSITEKPRATAAEATAPHHRILAFQELFGELKLFIFASLRKHSGVSFFNVRSRMVAGLFDDLRHRTIQPLCQRNIMEIIEFRAV